MGLWLPASDRTAVKVIYTGLEFGLIGMAGQLCYWDSICFTPMLLVTAIRSCLLFQRLGQIIIATALFSFFTLANHLVWHDFEFSTAIILNESISLTPAEPAVPIEALPAEVGALIDSQERLELLRFQMQNTFFFGLVLVFVLLLINALLSERENRRKLASAHAQLYDYANQIEDQATLQERNRIAREIHDSLGHLLTEQSIQLDNGLFFLPEDLSKAQTFFQAGKQLSTEALKELRQSISTLRCNSLERKRLVSEVTRTADNFRKMTGIEVSCRLALDSFISTEIRTAVFRIVEEALTNVYKHSRATRVGIDLHIEHTEGVLSQLVFTVEDNGLGFIVTQNATGFGLRGMRERAVALGGCLAIESNPHKGCLISGNFPLKRILK